MTSLSISAIRVMEPCRVNPKAIEAEAAVTAFAEKWGLKLPGFEAYNTVFAHLFPTTDLPNLVAVGIINCLLFYIDDEAVRARLHQSHTERPDETLTHVFRDGILPPKPTNLQQAFYELRCMVLELLPVGETQWLYRLANSLDSYFSVTNRPAELLGPVEKVDVDEYREWRGIDSGMWTCIDSVEFTLNLYLPPEILEEPVLRRMQRNVVEIVALMNDIFSYHREITIENYHYNLIAIFMAKYNIPLETAFNEAVTLVNCLIEDFYKAESRVPIWDENHNYMVRQYIMALKYQIATAWHWQLGFTERYHSANSPFVELRR